MIYKTIKTLGILALVCLLIAGCAQEPAANEKEEISTDDQNKAAVQAVLEASFTVPSEEYNVIVQNLDKKMDELQTGNPEDAGAEIQAYEDLVKKTYAPYFMDYAADKLITHVIAFPYHYGFFGYEDFVRYEMKISDIQVTQSENERTPKSYDFIAQVEYKNNSGEDTMHQIKGDAILSEPGKIGQFNLRDDDGIRDKVAKDQQSP